MKIESKNIFNIPLITYEKTSKEKNPVIFFFHGFTGNKDTLMGRGELLANLGFYVVAIDAYLHGAREENWFKILTNDIKYQHIIDIEIKTASDALMLWEKYFSKQDNILENGFYAYGVSMGAGVTFYLSTITKKLISCVCLVGSPSFVEYYQDRSEKFSWDKEVLAKRIEDYKTKDPLLNYKKMGDTNLFIAIGSDDEVVLPKYSMKLKEIKNENIEFKIYKTGHISTPEMLEDSYNFLVKEKSKYD